MLSPLTPPHRLHKIHSLHLGLISRHGQVCDGDGDTPQGGFVGDPIVFFRYVGDLVESQTQKNKSY